jgi:aspartyl-tRNA(Asn)/glutamyl-tRNA(Gln) amidotransferase subunit A
MIDEFLEVKLDIEPVKEGLLSGYSVSFKDCICIKGVETKSSSEILKGYMPCFDAHVVKKIKNSGAKIIGKTKQDEFGFGSFGLNHKKPPKNPLNPLKVIGGSSSGAGGITKVLDKHIAIAESTGGSIANPATFCEVTSITPTYGRVSRYGLIDYATSLDKIGVISNDVKSCALALETISGYDEKDSTSKNVEVDKFSNLKPSKNFKIGIPREYLNVDEGVKKVFEKAIKELENLGVEIKYVSLENNFKFSVPCYYLIATSEASTNLAKFCGLRYGASENVTSLGYNDYFTKIRSKYFSKEAKRRIILGTFARREGNKEEFYDKALKVRKALHEEYKQIFKEVDLILHPSMPCFTPKITDIEHLSPNTVYGMDLMTVGVNLAGLAHMSLPFKKKGFESIGLLLSADEFEESKLIKFGLFLESNLK